MFASLSLFTYFLFFPFLSFLFQPFQTPFTAVHKKFMSQSLRDFRSGTVVSNDHETPRTVEQQPVGKFVQQSFEEAPRVKLSKPTQSKPKPICDRSGKPEDTERVLVDKGKRPRSQEIDDKRLHKELGSSDRTGKPVKLSEDIRVKHVHDGTGNL